MVQKRSLSVDNIQYKTYRYLKDPKNEISINPLGIDTEAFITGECFMIATSLGDVFQPEDFPRCLFSRRYINKSFVAYNLKYDEGAFLQQLPRDNLETLRKTNATSYEGYTYKSIPRKCLSIIRGKNGIHIYDMCNFYNMSLDNASKAFLHQEKADIFTKDFYPFLVYHYWQRIADYCVNDAILVCNLASIMIKKFESWGVRPKRLYSIAYVSFQYFRSKTNYVTVKRYWEKKKEVLNYAMASYNGGKFEVTQKGTGYFYEYDIISAYPFEISNLIDISWARVVQSKRYRKGAVYGFLRCKMKIPFNVPSPIAVKRGYVNTYPCGEIEKVITKTEYEYLVGQGTDITIIDAYWLHIDNRQYPYRKEIKKLVALKQQAKQEGKDFDYHVLKKMLNSFYGKMVQLIWKGGYYEAGISWNPIFGSVITANVRCRVSEMQSKVSDCIAVHTDSVITTRKAEIDTSNQFGSFDYETEGQGVILGSGIYQIGDKTKFRGFESKVSLWDLIKCKRKKVKMESRRPVTWREVVFHKWDMDRINRFEVMNKDVSIDFDTKRLWLNDWKTFEDVEKRNVESIPLIVTPALF